MRTIAILLLSFLSLSLAIGADVRWTYSDFTTTAQTVKKVYITPIASYGTNGNTIITGDRRVFTNDSAGSLIVSNVIVGRSYRVEFKGAYTDTVITNSFDSTVTGFVEAVNYIAAPLSDGGLTSYSKTAADARFHNVSGDTSTNAAFRGTFKIPAGATVGYVLTVTNADGSSAWSPGSGGVATANTSNAYNLTFVIDRRYTNDTPHYAQISSSMTFTQASSDFASLLFAVDTNIDGTSDFRRTNYFHVNTGTTWAKSTVTEIVPPGAAYGFTNISTGASTVALDVGSGAVMYFFTNYASGGSSSTSGALTNNDTRGITFLNGLTVQNNLEVSSISSGAGNLSLSPEASGNVVISVGQLVGNGGGLTNLTGAGSSIAAGTNIVTVTNGSLVTVHGTANVTQAGLAAGSYTNIKLMGSNYSLNLNYNPATGQDTNYIVMTNRQIKFYGSALDTGITWDGAGTVSAGGGYFQFGSTAYGGSFLVRAQNIGIEAPVDYGSIRLTDDHRLDGLVKLGNQAVGGLVFPSNNYSGMLAFQSPVTNGAGDFIPGYAGIRAKNATGVSVQSVLGEGQSQAELWLYTLIPLQYANASGGFRSVGDTNWFMIGVTNSAVVKGVTIVSNSVSQWPTSARQNGDVMLVNSNGYLYSLNAYYNSTAWTSTNLLSSPTLVYDTNAQNFFTASGLSDNTQKAAVNNLVTSLKASGSLWSKMQVIYPFVGGTSNTHSWNLKDTNTFRVAWTTTGLTHDGNGVTGNGSSGYGNTQYTPSTSASLNDSHLTVYCRTQTPTDAGRFISVTTGATPTTRFELHRNSSSFSAEIHNNTFDSLGVSTDFRGFLGASRTGSSAVGLVNSSSSTTTTTASVSLSAQPVFLLARNWPDYGTDSYSSANLAFATIGAGLSVSELQDLRTIVNAYQTALSRQVP